MTTLTIGQVLLQVFTTNVVLADERAGSGLDAKPPQPCARALSRIWPIGRSGLPWPPGTCVYPGVLDKAANWDQPTTQLS